MLVTPRKAAIVVVLVTITVVLLIFWTNTEGEARPAWETTTETEYEDIDSDEEPDYKEDKLWDKFDPNEVKSSKDIFFISSSGYY